MTRLLPVSGTPSERVGAIARLQRGRVSRRQLLAAGVRPSAIGRMVSKGSLDPEHAGIYAVGHTAPTPLARETAALLACGDGAVLSHTSAAVAWDLIAETSGPVEVTLVDARTGRRRPGIRVHQSRNLTACDMQIRERLPLTTPARTIVDLAACIDTRGLERALDEALVVRRIAGRDQILDALDRSGGRAGAAVLKRMLARRMGLPITHSEAERRCLELIRKAGLPEPQTHVMVGGFNVDFLWPAHRVVFEIDGYTFHTSRSAFDRDRRKDNALKAASYDPNRLTRDQVIFEPYFVVATIAAALARAAPR